MSVDPIADQFAWVNGYNYAENEPIGHIDLWGLQKFWASSGQFLKSEGDDNSIRVVDANNVEEFNSLTTTEEMLKASVPAYEYTKSNVESRLKKWGVNNRNTSHEKAMSIYIKWLEAEDGFGYFPVFVEGSTVRGLGRSVNILDSKSPFPGDGWRRGSTIHTHPSGQWYEFSNEPGEILGGDIQVALRNNITLYMVPPGGPRMGKFDPSKYRQFVQRKLDEYNQKALPHQQEKMKGQGGDYWLSPHWDWIRPIVTDMIRPVYLNEP